MADITLADLLNADKKKRNQALFGQFGMDPNGNNEVGAWARRIAQPLGYNAASRVAFMNQLEPQRQAVMSSYINSLMPENIYSQAAAMRNRLQGGVAGQGQDLAHMLELQGLGAGAQAGAYLHAQNQATDAANQYLMALASPEGRQQSYANLMNAYNQAQDLNLENLYNTGNFIEQRYQQNQADRKGSGLGGILGTIGGLAGMAGGLGWSPFGKGK